MKARYLAILTILGLGFASPGPQEREVFISKFSFKRNQEQFYKKKPLNIKKAQIKEGLSEAVLAMLPDSMDYYQIDPGNKVLHELKKCEACAEQRRIEYKIECEVKGENPTNSALFEKIANGCHGCLGNYKEHAAVIDFRFETRRDGERPEYMIEGLRIQTIAKFPYRRWDVPRDDEFKYLGKIAPSDHTDPGDDKFYTAEGEIIVKGIKTQKIKLWSHNKMFSQKDAWSIKWLRGPDTVPGDFNPKSDIFQLVDGFDKEKPLRTVVVRMEFTLRKVQSEEVVTVKTPIFLMDTYHGHQFPADD